MVQCAVFAGKEIKDCTRGEACVCAAAPVDLQRKCIQTWADRCGIDWDDERAVEPHLYGWPKEYAIYRDGFDAATMVMQPALDRITGKICALEDALKISNNHASMQRERAERAEAENANLTDRLALAMAENEQLPIWKGRAINAEAALRGGVVVPVRLAEHLEAMSLEVGGKCRICEEFRGLLAAAKEGK